MGRFRSRLGEAWDLEGKASRFFFGHVAFGVPFRQPTGKVTKAVGRVLVGDTEMDTRIHGTRRHHSLPQATSHVSAQGASQVLPHSQAEAYADGTTVHLVIN